MTSAEVVELRQVFTSLQEGVRWADIMDGRVSEQIKAVEEKEVVEAEKPRRGRPAGAKNKAKKADVKNKESLKVVVKDEREDEPEPDPEQEQAQEAPLQASEDDERILKRIANARRFKEQAFQKLLKSYDLTEENFQNIGTEALLQFFNELAMA